MSETFYETGCGKNARVTGTCHGAAAGRGEEEKKKLIAMLPGFPDSELLEDYSHRAELGQAILEQVGSDKGREPEPIFA